MPRITRIKFHGNMKDGADLIVNELTAVITDGETVTLVRPTGHETYRAGAFIKWTVLPQ